MVHQGLIWQSQGRDIDGRERIDAGLAELTSAVVVVSRSQTGQDLILPSRESTVTLDGALKDLTLPNYAYDPFFLRGESPG